MISRAAGPVKGHGWVGRATAVALAAFALAACGDRARPGQGVAADDAPVYGGTMVVACTSDLDGANALTTGEARTADLLRNALYMTLVRYDQELDVVPYLARSWELLGDTGVVLRLRDDIRWHDGEPTTAHDVEFTFRRAMDPETGFPNQDYFRAWTAVEVLDSFTVRIRYRPHTEPLDPLTVTPIMPRHKLESIPAAQLRQAEFNRSPVGNGPFRFVSQRVKDRWIFEANPDFPEELGGRPYLDRLVWRVIPEQTAQVTELLAGSMDLILNPPSSQLRELDARPEVRAILRASRQYQFIGWNGRRPPLDDARVRRALSLAINRGEMLETLRGGFGQLAAGPIPPYHWAFDHAVEPLPFDPAGAKALLAGAGYVDRNGDGTVEDAQGKPLTLSITIPAGSEYNKSVAEMTQAYLAGVGVRLTLRPLDFATMISDIFSPDRRFDSFVLAWETDIRLDLKDIFHSTSDGEYQMASYRNPEVDGLLDRAARMTSREAARPLWQRVQTILRDEQPFTFLYYTPDLFAAHERLQGVEMDIRGIFATLPRWWKAGARPVGEE